VIKFDIIGSI